MTQATSTTLTDFLLERIAEDEKAAGEPFDSDGRIYALAHYEDCPHLDRDRPYPCECGLTARIHAECEAKRRMVERWRLYSDAQYPDYEGGYSSAMDDVLALLALPYADHPDYRDEWRP